jgi:hypothetical protein
MQDSDALIMDVSYVGNHFQTVWNAFQFLKCIRTLGTLSGTFPEHWKWLSSFWLFLETVGAVPQCFWNARNPKQFPALFTFTFSLEKL